MTSKEEEIKELENLIIYHKRQYYDGEPIISDAEYDALEYRLRELDPQNPVLFIVGSPEDGEVIHDPPMLSCKKAKTLDDVISWAEGKDLYMGYKVDGLSLKIIYQDGKLVQAATRGNGLSGEDVTLNVMKIAAIPKTISHKEKVEVRGELYMRLSEFNRINETLADEQYSSPRNLAVGTLKQKDAKILDERTLDFKAWDLIDGAYSNNAIEEIVQILNAWGFDITDFKLLTQPDKEAIIEVFEGVERERENLDFEIDGVVFKYNDATARESAGVTEHHPKWQMALKFASKGATTLLKAIKWQLGRTGVLTPVAALEPVELAGAIISRATLHNADFLTDLNANVGDRVYVERSGDVIPTIIKITAKHNSERVTPPTACPSCGAPTGKNGVNIICTGEKCRDRDLQAILYWTKITGIEGIGPKSAEKLYDEGLVQHYSDLYSLEKQQLVDLLGKNGETIYNNIENTRQLPFHIFLAALGITSLGKKMGKTLAKHFNSFKELQEASIGRLTQIEGISDVTANYIQHGVNNKENYQRLLENGLEIVYKTKKIPAQRGPLTQFLDSPQPVVPSTGKKVYVTGKIQGYTKKDIQELVEDHGFEWATSISSKLDLLVTGEKAGGKKLEKAKLKGIKIVTWEEFVANYIKNGVTSGDKYRQVLENDVEIVDEKQLLPLQSDSLEATSDVSQSVNPIIENNILVTEEIKEVNQMSENTGKRIYVTGKIEGYNKKDIQKLIEDHGFKWATFNKKLDLLVTGEKPGPKKLKQAEEFGITVVSWEEFVANLSDDQ
jgi:DNA ligase (NAD+)